MNELEIGSLVLVKKNSAAYPIGFEIANDIGLIIAAPKAWVLCGRDIKVYWMISHKIFWYSREYLKGIE